MGKIIINLPPMTATDLATDDRFAVEDVSLPRTKSITSDELSKFILGRIQDKSISYAKLFNPYMFHAYRTGAQAAGVVVYNNISFDTNNNFNTSNGRYTVPVDGFYQLNVISHQTVTAAPQDPMTTIRKNGTTEIGYSHFVNMYNGGSSGTANVSVLVKLTAGDYLEVVASRASDVSNASRCNFSGFLVSTL